MKTPVEPESEGPLPEITLRSAGAEPPMVLADEVTMMPCRVLPWSIVPVGSSPMKLPTITLFPADSVIPFWLNRLMTSPLMVQLAALMVKPSVIAPAFAPFSSINRMALSPTASVFGCEHGAGLFEHGRCE